MSAYVFLGLFAFSCDALSVKVLWSRADEPSFFGREAAPLLNTPHTTLAFLLPALSRLSANSNSTKI